MARFLVNPIMSLVLDVKDLMLADGGGDLFSDQPYRSAEFKIDIKHDKPYDFCNSFDMVKVKNEYDEVFIFHNCIVTKHFNRFDANYIITYRYVTTEESYK